MRRGTAGMERPVTVWRGAAWHGKAGGAGRGIVRRGADGLGNAGMESFGKARAWHGKAG